MKKVIVIIIVILAVITGYFIVNSENTAKNEDEIIKIGVIIPLTGKGATWGENIKDAVELAYSELSPKEQERFEIIYEDDQLDPALTVSAYKKLSTINGVNAFITVGSVSAGAVAPLVEADKNVMFAITNDPAVTEGRVYTFKHFFLPETDSDALIAEVQKRGYEKVALITTKYQGVLAIKDLFLGKAGDLEIFDAGEFEPNEKDLRTSISKIKSEDVDAIGMFMMPGQLGITAKQIREAGIDVPIFSIGTIEDKNELALGGNAMEGIWFSSPAGPLSWFKESFSESYGKDAGLFTGNAYDIANIYFDILPKATDSDDAVQMFNAIENYRGAMGDSLAMDNANNISIGAVIKEIRGGKFITISE